MNEPRERAARHDAFQRILDNPVPRQSWWTEPERVSIAEAVQGAAHCTLCNRLQDAGPCDIIGGEHEHAGDLPDPIIDAIHLLTRFESSLDNHWYDSVLQVVEPEAFVELLGIMNVTMSLQSLQGDVGLPRDLPPASRPYRTRRPPRGLQLEVGWAGSIEPSPPSSEPVAQAS